MSEEGGFLARWSRRKIEARAPSGEGREPAEGPEPLSSEATAAAPPAPPEQPQQLPDVEKLTPESDFSPFMREGVEPQEQARALRKLFSDPHFSTVDMLDVYMDDYSLPDPLPEGWLEKLEQMAGIGDRAGRDREEAERRRLGGEQPAGEPKEEPEASPPQVAGAEEAPRGEAADGKSPDSLGLSGAGDSLQPR